MIEKEWIKKSNQYIRKLTGRCCSSYTISEQCRNPKRQKMQFTIYEEDFGGICQKKEKIFEKKIQNQGG